MCARTVLPKLSFLNLAVLAVASMRMLEESLAYFG